MINVKLLLLFFGDFWIQLFNVNVFEITSVLFFNEIWLDPPATQNDRTYIV